MGVSVTVPPIVHAIVGIYHTRSLALTYSTHSVQHTISTAGYKWTYDMPFNKNLLDTTGNECVSISAECKSDQY